jgi:hypothetical protein
VAVDPAGFENLAGNFALRAINEGMSANKFVAALREAGLGIRRQAALRVYGQAQRLVAEYGQEITKPLDQVPGFDPKNQWPTKGATGVLQNVQLVYREAVTGRQVVRYFNIKTEAGVTRADAIAAAVDANAAGAEEYQQSLVGAFYTGTRTLVNLAAA